MKRALLVALVLLAACTKTDIENASHTVASDAPKLANDGIAVVRVEAELVRIDADSALHVAVSVHDGEARLRGNVRSAGVATRFESAARGVPGVTGIDSRLTIDPHLPATRDRVSDFALAASVRASLVAQAGINGVSVGVAARAGTVELSGSVPTAAIRATLADAAKHTRGVRSVADRLQVRP